MFYKIQLEVRFDGFNADQESLQGDSHRKHVTFIVSFVAPCTYQG